MVVTSEVLKKRLSFGGFWGTRPNSGKRSIKQELRVFSALTLWNESSLWNILLRQCWKL